MKIIIGSALNKASSKIATSSKVVYLKNEYIIIVKLDIASIFWMTITFSLEKYSFLTKISKTKYKDNRIIKNWKFSGTSVRSPNAIEIRKTREFNK